MGYTISKVLKNAILVGIITFLSGLVAYGGLPTVNVLYAVGISASLAAALSYERGETQSSSPQEQNTNKTNILDLLP